MMATMDMGAQGVTEDVTELTEYVKEKIWLDPLAADLQWSLFLAALKSYRHDSVLRPFPSIFQADNGEKDLKSMLELVEEVPSLSRLPRECHTLPSKLLELIRWVLDTKSFTISHIDKSKISEIRKKTGNTVKAPEPNYIFEVTPSEVADAKFEHLRDDRELLYAYHGSRLDNFHSILHNGLASHMNKTSVFGEGTYLSEELSVSLIYSPTGVGWDGSDIGNRLSCVAVCEMIDDPSVKCQNKSVDNGRKGSSGSLLRSRANAGPSEGGNVPEKYYVAQNNEMIRVRYLIVYASKASTHRSAVVSRRRWFHKHKFALMMAMYFVILCAIGLSNSHSFRNMLRRLWKDR